MTSWWRLTVEQLGGDMGAGGRCWPHRAAVMLGATGNPGHGWPAKIARTIGVQSNTGSWTKRMVPISQLQHEDGAAERELLDSGHLVEEEQEAGADLVNTAAPSISGSPVLGQTLTAIQGTWAGDVGEVTYRYHWLADGLFISGAATGPTFVLTPATMGALVRVVETAEDAAGSVSTSSTSVGPVTAL